MTRAEAIYLVVGLNSLIAVGVFCAAYFLWRWKQQLRELSGWLREVDLGPQRLRYAITLQRVQLAQQRLEVARWQRRSQQLREFIQLVQLLRLMVLIRSGRYSLITGRVVKRPSKK